MAKKKTALSRPAKKKPGPVHKTIRDIVIIVVAFVVIRLWVVEANVIPSGSMKDTLLVGDYILAEKTTYLLRDPHPGEIVTFIYPFRDMTAPQAVRFFLRNILGESRTGPRLLIKRVVAEPGDVLELKGNILHRNGEPAKEPYLFSDAGGDWGPYTVPPDKYFVMGDNRYDSADSRFIGPVPRKYITAKAEVVYFSLAPTTCPKHRTPITDANGEWVCSGGAEEMRPGWDFEAVSGWRLDRRIRWQRMGKLVRLLK
jgi:signal peptidase I